MMVRFAIALLCVAACADEYRDAALKRAEESVKAATEKASKDPSRPVYHFRPPANWMNDPNGTIRWYPDAYYHVFYQHNPYGDKWGHMHWGHARSRDFVHWEQLPIALWPSEDKGEAHVFSGCATVNGDDMPMLFYTSVSAAQNKRPNEQWAAIGDEDLVKWEKHPKNPILTTSSIPFEIGPDWRDPFIFRANKRMFMVCGADTKDEAIILLFEAVTPQLDNWTYRGVLYRQPKTSVQFFECPNFFPLDDKWVLIYSPYKPLRYIIGSFNAETYTFTPEKESTLDYGSFYASNIFLDRKTEPTILVGWVRGFKEGLGWNGCMSSPRRLWIGSDGYLRQFPMLTSLPVKKRGRVQKISENESLVESLARKEIGDTFMIEWLNGSGSAPQAQVSLIPKSDGGMPIQIKIGPDSVSLDDLDVPWPEKPGAAPISVLCYVDKTVLELFANSGQISITKVIEHSPKGYKIEGTMEAFEIESLEHPEN